MKTALPCEYGAEFSVRQDLDLEYAPYTEGKETYTRFSLIQSRAFTRLRTTHTRQDRRTRHARIVQRRIHRPIRHEPNPVKSALSISSVRPS